MLCQLPHIALSPDGDKMCWLILTSAGDWEGRLKMGRKLVGGILGQGGQVEGVPGNRQTWNRRQGRDLALVLDPILVQRAAQSSCVWICTTS